LPSPLTPLIGRRTELAAVSAVLASSRLVTLVGPGGCGKTRLAIEAAHRQARHGTAVAWWPLAELREPGLTVSSLATALGSDHSPAQADALVDALGDRAVLVVADNCEHLVGEVAALIATLLPACPELRVLATSRQALRAPGEHVWEVPPLGLPPDPGEVHGGPPVHATTSEAVQLFLDRAAAAGTAPGRADGAAVCRLVRRLEGLPLALELAAARTPTLTPQELDEQLHGALRLLVDDRPGIPVRQRTLAATVAWSHDLLGPAERALFRRLALFTGPFDREGVTAVAGTADGDCAVEILERLVQRHLVRSGSTDGRRWFRLLEPIRQFAAEQLAEAGEEDDVARRHAGHLLAVVRRADPAVRGRAGAAAQRAALTLVDRSGADLRSALGWARRTPGEHGLLLSTASTVWWAWWRLGRFAEGLSWLRAARAVPGGTDRERAEICHGVGWLARHQDSPDEAREALMEALHRYEDLGDDAACATVLHRLAAVRIDGYLLAAGGDGLGEAREFLADGAARARRSGKPWVVGGVAHWSGLLALAGQEPARAAEHLVEARAMFVLAGERWAVGRAAGVLGLALVRAGRLQDARAALAEAHRVSTALGDRWGLARWATAAAEGEAYEGRSDAALLRCAEAAAGFGELGDGVRVVEVAGLCAEMLDTVGRRTEAAELRAAAAALPRGRPAGQLAERIVELAGPENGTGEPAVPLSRREVEVLTLVARGCSDAEVARALYVSPRTVGGHLGAAYRKLGVTTRTGAARRGVQLGLLPGAGIPDIG
jgi:predicted ATPase/DNA-binding CsgD family transcriptional regulator